VRSSRTVNLAAALLLALPFTAAAQAVNLQNRVRAAPTGIAIPGVSIAGAEEPTAVQLNPAGAGFVDAFTLQYFHQGRSGTGLGEDGFWATAPLGGLVPTLAMEWIRPEDNGGSRFRKTTFGLALPRGQSFSIGIAANFYSSPDRALEDLWSLDAGATWRPLRQLSLGAAVRGMNAQLAGRRLPIHYDLGLATRLWHDRLTLSGDLLSDDQARGDLRAQAVQLGGSVQVGWGLALSLQWLLPLRSENGSYASYPLFALTFDGAHGGLTSGAGAGRGSEDTWLVGARLSSQRYRDGGIGPHPTPLVDVAQALSRSRSLLFAGPADPWGTLLRRLTEARDDPHVPALALRIDDLPLGQGRVEELRRLLLSIKSRKPVVAYLVGGGMKEYYLASAASAVLAPPSAQLFPSGLSSTTPFLGEGLSRLGVAFDVVAIGRYKNAPDPLIRRDMSDAQREVTNRILDDVFARQVRTIAAARGLEEARVRELVDVGVFNGEQALAAKLIDAVAWPDELDALASQRTGRRVRTSTSWDDSAPRAAQRWGPRPVVAVVRVEGTIASGKSRNEPLGVGIAGAETVARLVKEAASDPRVRALVLRVDSPGGDGLASDLIWREVMQARRAGKPVVASMGDLAASGGYLVSVGADAIVAEPSTLTGSIGVFALKPDLSGLLGKLGIATVNSKRGRHADLQSLTRRWTGEERELVERQVRAFYDLFIGRVVEGRRLTREAVERVAQGQVWTGAQALERGLVDRLGSFEDAQRLAAERAGLSPADEPELVSFEPERELLSGLVGGLELTAANPLLEAAARLPELQALAALLELGPVVALPPGWVPGVTP